MSKIDQPPRAIKVRRHRAHQPTQTLRCARESYRSYRSSCLCATRLITTLGLLAAAYLLLLEPVRAAPPPLSEQAARQRLSEAGLVNDGTLWRLPDEERLSRQFQKLDPLSRAIRASDNRLESMVQQNEARRLELQQVEQRMKQVGTALQKLRGEKETRQQLTRQLETLTAREQQLRKLYLPAKQFAAHDQVRHIVIAGINARNELGLLTLQLPAAWFDIQSRYELLGRQPAIRAALQALGPRTRLGGSRDYKRSIDRLGGYQKQAFDNVAPLYVLDGHERVSCIVNERVAATFTWSAESGPSIVPASLLRRANVELPETATVEAINHEGQRLQGRSVVLPYLRLGNRVVQDVPVLALPPEAEHVGGILRIGSISGLSGTPNHARARLDFSR